MKYDPIICMMIDDSVKTKDEVPNGWKVTLEKNRNKQYVYSKAMTARGASVTTFLIKRLLTKQSEVVIVLLLSMMMQSEILILFQRI